MAVPLARDVAVPLAETTVKQVAVPFLKRTVAQVGAAVSGKSVRAASWLVDRKGNAIQAAHIPLDRQLLHLFTCEVALSMGSLHRISCLMYGHDLSPALSLPLFSG